MKKQLVLGIILLLIINQTPLACADSTPDLVEQLTEISELPTTATDSVIEWKTERISPSAIISDDAVDVSVPVDPEMIDLTASDVSEDYFTVQYNDGTFEVRDISNSKKMDVEACVAYYDEKTNVVAAEPLVVTHLMELSADYVPNDANYATLWGIDAIDADMLYGKVTKAKQANVTVAVLDTGMDMDHPDLAGNLVTVDISGSAVHGYNAMPVDPDYNPDDGHGHGTHVSGIVAAIDNNSIGVAGVASGVKLMPVKVLDDAGYGTSASLAEGIYWAVDHGADVINMSLGSSTQSEIERLAVEYAYSKGVVVVAAAGNDSNNWVDGLANQYFLGNAISHIGVQYPAAYEHVIGVGAVGMHGGVLLLSDFSNSGTGVDVVAPGEEIYSTDKNASYSYKSGTSMASPYVAGEAALILAEYPAYSPEEIETDIENTARMVDSSTDATYGGSSNYYGAGLINAYAATYGDLRLHSLTISAGTLTPAFNSSVKSYTATVLNSIASIDLYLTAYAQSVIKVNGTVVVQGQGYNVPLTVGSNLINILVANPDGGTQTTTLTVSRETVVASPTVSPAAGGGGGGGGAVVPDVPETPPINAEVLVKPNAAVKLVKDALTISFEAGSFPNEFKASIKPVEYDESPFKDGIKLLGKVYILGKDVDLILRKSLNINFVYTAKEINDKTERPAIYYLDAKDQQWKELTGVTVDAVSGNVSAPTQMFTQYALVAVPVIKVVQEAAPIQKSHYDDLNNHWAEAGIYKLVDKGAVSGYPDGSFRPDSPITRAEFITILVKALKLTGTKEVTFTDTNNHWAASAIGIGYANGLVSGYSDGLLHPDNPITREQMAVMIDHTLRYIPEYQPGTTQDQNAVSAWAQKAVGRILAFKVMNGYPDNTFRPQALATRGEAVTVIIKAMGQ